MPVIDPSQLWLSVYHISPHDRAAWCEAGRGFVIGTPEALERAIEEASRVVPRKSGSDTVIFDPVAAPVVGVALAGLALPSVPMSDIVAGYAYALAPDGVWTHDHDAAICHIEVDGTGAWVRATAPGVVLSGRPLSIGERAPLHHADLLAAASREWTYSSLDSGYTGAMLGDVEQPLALHDGEAVELGREPSTPGLTFPERRGTANLRWCVGSRGARAKASGFTLDRALVGRRQARVGVDGGRAHVTQLHDRCPTWLLRHHARKLALVEGDHVVGPGDHLIVGTHVLSVVAPTEV